MSHMHGLWFHAQAEGQPFTLLNQDGVKKRDGDFIKLMVDKGTSIEAIHEVSCS